MTTPNPILQQLKDIETPSQIGAWPLAWGWWVLIIIAVLTTAYCFWRLYKNWQFNAPLRHAKSLLKGVNHDDINVGLINQVLKRVALHYGEREQVASLYSEQWRDWLNANQSKVTFTTEELNLVYQQRMDVDIKAEFMKKAELWLNAINVKKLSNLGGEHV